MRFVCYLSYKKPVPDQIIILMGILFLFCAGPERLSYAIFDGFRFSMHSDFDEPRLPTYLAVRSLCLMVPAHLLDFREYDCLPGTSRAFLFVLSVWQMYFKDGDVLCYR